MPTDLATTRLQMKIKLLPLVGLALLLAGVFGVSVEALFEIDQEEQHE